MCVTPVVHDATVMEISEPSITGGNPVSFTAIPSVPTPVPVAMAGTRSGRAAVPADAFTIDCADCEHQRTSVCDDCVVSFIVGRQPEDAIVIDADEARAVRLLEQAGLVPGVRHSRQAV
jgi:hypothetical protein